MTSSRTLKRMLALLPLGVSAIAGATPASEAPGPFADAATATTPYTATPFTPITACASLTDQADTDMKIVSAMPVAGDGQTPAFCRVIAHIAPAISIEVDLPSQWNARFYMIGNGGSAGEPNDDSARIAARARALRHGFIAASTNTGHDRSADGYAFAVDDQKLADYGSRAVHLSSVVAKRLAKDFYGQSVRFSYWDGCSTGGREGLMEAQRYPADFDGIIAGAPALDFTGLLLQHLWIQKAIEQTPLSLAKIHLVGQALYAQCDALDGLKDGLIADPERCNFKVGRDVPQCSSGDADTCLTPAEVTAFNAIYTGPTDRGRNIFPGLALSAEPGIPAGRSTGWDVDAKGMAKGGIDVAESQLRNAVFHQPDYDWHRFDLKSDLPALTPLGRAVNATNPDLAKFRNRGGRLLIYYGWADTTLNPKMGLRYFKSVRAMNGANTGSFFKLFMIPGMFHCRGGYGPDKFDAISAMVDWVEAGKGPAHLIATQTAGSADGRTRPLCPYPQVATYRGSGSPDQAGNFRCATPGAAAMKAPRTPAKAS